jgi:hypothetical protein
LKKERTEREREDYHDVMKETHRRNKRANFLASEEAL